MSFDLQHAKVRLRAFEFDECRGHFRRVPVVIIEQFQTLDERGMTKANEEGAGVYLFFQLRRRPIG